MKLVKRNAKATDSSEEDAFAQRLGAITSRSKVGALLYDHDQEPQAAWN